MLAEIAEADDADVDAGGQGRPAAYDPVWSRMPGSERAKYLFRIARIIQERGRELAVLESIDNGKPIKESRDVDVPIAAAHFFYYAGWADKLEHAGYGTTPLGVAGQVIPWNFPLLMLAWKIAPALACGNTVVLKPAETTPLTALLFAEICQQADLPPGVVNIVTGAGATGQALVVPPRRRQGRVHRLDRGRQGDRPVGRRARNKKVTLELGGKAANIVFDDAPIDQAVEGIVNGIFFNQGHVCCAGLAAARAGVRGRRGARAAQAPDVDAARRRPARQEHRHRRDQLRRAAAPDPRARPTSARPRAPSAGSRRASCRPSGFWFPPTIFTGVTQAHRIAREEIFGPVLSVLTFRTPDRGGREGQQHAVRPLRRRLDRQGLAHPLDGRPAPRRRGVGQHVQQVRPDQPVRRLQGVGLRPRGRPPRAWRPT